MSDENNKECRITVHGFEIHPFDAGSEEQPDLIITSPGERPVRIESLADAIHEMELVYGLHLPMPRPYRMYAFQQRLRRRHRHL